MNTKSEPSHAPTLEEVVTAFNDRHDSVVLSNFYKLRSEYGQRALVPFLIEALPNIRNATGQIHIMFDLIPLARWDARIVEAANWKTDQRPYACTSVRFSHTAFGTAPY